MRNIISAPKYSLVGSTVYSTKIYVTQTYGYIKFSSQQQTPTTEFQDIVNKL